MLSKAEHIAGALYVPTRNNQIKLECFIAKGNLCKSRKNFGVKVAGCTQHFIVHAIELINESKLHFHDALQLTRDQLRTRNALMQINFHVRGQRATRSMDCRPRGPDHKYFDFISEGASNLITSYRRPGT